MSEGITLTVSEIKDLAEFAGFKIEPISPRDFDDMETEIVIAPCPKDGVTGDDKPAKDHYRFVAYLEEYPEEGAYPLGPKLERSYAKERGE